MGLLPTRTEDALLSKRDVDHTWPTLLAVDVSPEASAQPACPTY